MNFPESFKLDGWYNLIILFGGIIFFCTLFGFTSSSVPVIPTLLVSLGVIILGIGEMINHQKLYHIEPTPRGDYTWFRIVRIINPWGITLDIIAIAVMALGIYKYFS